MLSLVEDAKGDRGGGGGGGLGLVTVAVAVAGGILPPAGGGGRLVLCGEGLGGLVGAIF